MTNKKRNSPRKNEYPPIYEKGVPIILGFIALGIVVVLVIIVGVALGLF
ncbi:MAG TPA: hypothetical protein G4N96_09495 [Chloroflexi bacterium]|nr:hypothetical protein [Chloroflexota bacterium]